MKTQKKTNKDTLSIFSSSKGFTLLELLVVVLIIGILASIALPQYQMAVTKAKVASILPLMRRWKDAMYEYELQHGDYKMDENYEYPNGAILGVNWPSDWECEDDDTSCSNDYWVCSANEEIETGAVDCYHKIDDTNAFAVSMYQPDDNIHDDLRGLITCEAHGTEGHKVCKSLGGKLLEEESPVYKLY